MSAKNTTSALSVGELALALVVGVNLYRDKAIEPLESAAEEARLLGRTLTDPTASRLPEENVTILVDGAATHGAVLAALERKAVAAGPAQTIFFYFAGHAVDADGGFVLIAHDTDRSDLMRTGIGSSAIDRILSSSAARGILVVMDCCGGAALAENAPGLFRTVGRRSEYRILLSSARAGQSSWEGRHGSRFSRALIDVLAGKTAVASEAGAIFFSDLYRHLHDSVTTAPEAGDIEATRQEPIAAASYARDPLLFVNANLTLAQVRVRVQRYSKAQMRAALRRWSIAAAATIALGATGLLAYLHGHQYLTVEGDVVALYRGVPGWRLFDYPALLWQFGVDRE